MSPKEALQTLNEAAIEGTLDPVQFLEQNFQLEGKLFTRRNIKFEDWQIEHVLVPVFRKVNRQRVYDTYLIGLPKKNGKSTLASGVATYALLLDDPHPEVLGTAFDKDQAHVIFNSTKKAFERSAGLRPLVKIYKDVIERIDGNGIYKVIASESAGAHGQNPSCVLWDELWSQGGYDLWEALTHSPARENPFHFVTTYAGYQARSGNPLWDLYSRGMRNDDPRQYTFWRSGADANVASWVTPAYLESQRRRLPDHIYRRLHSNEWSIDSETQVFHIAPESWQGFFQEPLQGSTYTIGIDLAKYKDFSAAVVVRTDVDPYRVVHLTKLPHIDYSAQVQILTAIIKRYECPSKPKVLIDRGAGGPAVTELLRKAGIELEEFTFTSESKQKIVTDLAVAFEQRKIILPQTGRTLEESRAIADLEKELFHFEPEVLKSGNIRYQASGGYFDDLVIALCLAYAGATTKRRRVMWPTVPTGGAPDTRDPYDPMTPGRFVDPQAGKNLYDPFLELPHDNWTKWH
jgi:hypothetical protein